jgi:hypothetical protein
MSHESVVHGFMSSQSVAHIMPVLLELMLLDETVVIVDVELAPPCEPPPDPGRNWLKSWRQPASSIPEASRRTGA